MSGQTVAEGLARLILLDSTLGLETGDAGRIGILLSVAGVRLPAQVVTTREELAKLPHHAVVRGVDDDVYERAVVGRGWWTPGDEEWVDPEDVPLPVQVLWEPDQ